MDSSFDPLWTRFAINSVLFESLRSVGTQCGCEVVAAR